MEEEKEDQSEMPEEKLKEIYEDLKMKCFMIKKFELIPKIVFPMVIELCFIFIYVIQNIACRDLVSGQVQFYSWIFLIAYFIYHSKLGFSFLKTFIDLMKDKEEANEVEQSKRQITSKDEYMVVYAIGILTMILGVIIGQSFKQNRLYFYSIILYAHSTVLMFHGWNLKDFFMEPDQEEVKQISDRKIADRKERLKHEKTS